MKDVQSKPSGPQLYLLSEAGYEELKSIQGTLVLMARIAHNGESEAAGETMLTISRAEISRYFMDISAQIGAALSRLDKENWVGKQAWMWQ